MNCEVIGSELISRMYGITQDPSSNDYAIVTKFYENGNLRQAISQTDCSISWCKIIRIFCQITVALFTMHRKEFIHRDFHSGNILIRTKSNHFLEAVISDFGMSLHPDSETSGSTTVYGVLPFVAPEVLHDQVYTTACDIYGFGMIMYEVLSGKPPFFERNCDGALAVDICTRGKRPEIPEYAPEPYVTLMKKCWDSDRTKRPDAGTLSDEFNKWFRILMKVDDDSEGIYQAFTSSEEKWKTQLQVSQSRENLHSLYTSKSIVNTREFLINTTDSSENYDIQSTAIQYKY
jgi:serine/threonine protein kinase